MSQTPEKKDALACRLDTTQTERYLLVKTLRAIFHYVSDPENWLVEDKDQAVKKLQTLSGHVKGQALGGLVSVGENPMEQGPAADSRN